MFSLTQKMSGRFKDDMGGGFRGNTADFSSTVPIGQRGGTGDEVSSNVPGQPHSSSGFRRALERTARRGSNRIVGLDKTHFGMGNNNKPNYFGQGQRRHGMHIGAGAPFTGSAVDTGSEVGAE